MLTCWLSTAQETEAGLHLVRNADKQWIEVYENAVPVLRYNHGATEVPDGIGKEFARGDYVHPLYGPNGEVLTADYPPDHPHHRAVNWSWATVQWRGEVRDLFAVRGIWARPVAMDAKVDLHAATIKAESVWQWDDKEPVVNEKVTMLAYPETESGRAIDFEIELTALVNDLSFCGRIEAGYSGFNLRMAAAPGQQIVFHTDAPEAAPRRSWGDYSAEFPGSPGRVGVTVLQHPATPLYPGEWREYPSLNFYQPIHPGGRLIPMPKAETITLKYRLWIHPGGADEAKLAAAWDAYLQPATIEASASTTMSTSQQGVRP